MYNYLHMIVKNITIMILLGEFCIDFFPGRVLYHQEIYFVRHIRYMITGDYM